MRFASLVVLIGCAPTRLPPTQLPDLVQPEPVGVIDTTTYDNKVASIRATLARSHIELDAGPVIESCGEHHGIKGCVHCDVATRRDTSGVDPDMLDAIAIAFARYPQRVLDISGIQYVALCKDIHYSQVHDGVPQPAGMAMPSDARLLLSLEPVAHIADYGGDFTIEQVVHHEVFHMLDKETDDHAWQNLDPPEFVYRDPAPLDESKRPIGFVNNYATTNEREDRASTFEYMIGQPEKLCAIERVDPIVAKKVRLVRARVAKLMGSYGLPAERCKAQRPVLLRGRHALHVVARSTHEHAEN
jgi:hypothetical protein